MKSRRSDISQVQSELSPERRALLARKGEILYGKFCGTRGQGICAESFAVYQLRIGQPEVVEDLIGFLDAKIQALREHDPEGRLALTEALASRIRRHLEVEA